MDTKTKYSHIENLVLLAMQSVQRFRHYILFCKTTIISNCNPPCYILLCQIHGRKYSKWIVILQEFVLEFVKSESNKSLIFMELICDLPSSNLELTIDDIILDETLFLINSFDPWYGDIIIYLQNQTFWTNTTRFDQCCIRYQTSHYIIINDTLYHRGVNTIFRRCLTHGEVMNALNDCHTRAYSGHMYRYATS